MDHFEEQQQIVPYTVPSTRSSQETTTSATSTEETNSVVLLSPVHTVLLFVPGNPGLIDWYIPFFEELLCSLGPGFAARGVANAGHSFIVDRATVAAAHLKQQNSETSASSSSTEEEVPQQQQQQERDTSIPWTVEGQVLHKVAFLDHVIKELDNNHRWCDSDGIPKHHNSLSRDNDKECNDSTSSSSSSSNKPISFVIISHSIGAHFTQRLCVLRPDLLKQKRIQLLIHLTPFIRMDAPQPKQYFLFAAATYPKTIAAWHRFMMKVGKTILPEPLLDVLLRLVMTQDEEARRITRKLLRTPEFADNFFRLGLEEIRDCPELFDEYAFRVIGQYAPTVMLFAGNDQWSPDFHIADLYELQQTSNNNNEVPPNITVTYRPHLKHDFITERKQRQEVANYCVQEILKVHHQQSMLQKYQYPPPPATTPQQLFRSRL